MKKKCIFGVLICAIAAVLLAGCVDRDRNELGTPSTSPISYGDAKRVAASDLQKYVNRLISLDHIYQNHKVKFQSSYTDEKSGAGFLQIRRIGDHSKPYSEEEKDALRQSIYEAIGAKFPLAIEAYTIGKQPMATGRITAIDETGRLLIVSSDKYLDQEKKMLDAAWYGMADDGIILYEGKLLALTDIKIGSTVKAWSEGLMLTSYPEQTTGLKLEITALDDGTGDARGVVTALTKTGEGVNIQRTIEIDEVKYDLSSNAQVWLNGEKKAIADIKTGDHVKIWFSGLTGLPMSVTQVVVER